MEVFSHNLESLFRQLGLPSEPKAIVTFVEKHRLSEFESIGEASFWTPSQRQFINEAHLQDADWSEQIDTLDTLLHKPS